MPCGVGAAAGHHDPRGHSSQLFEPDPPPQVQDGSRLQGSSVEMAAQWPLQVVLHVQLSLSSPQVSDAVKALQ